MNYEIYKLIINAAHDAYKDSPQQFHNKIFTEGQLATIDSIVRLDTTLEPKEKNYLLELIEIVTPKH